MNRNLLTIIALAGLTTAYSSFAAKGPIKISADNVIVNQNTLSSTYSGNVQLEQGGMSLKASTLKVFTKNKRLSSLEATGSPAELNNTGNGAQPLQGYADTILYNASNGDVVFSGNAKLLQSDNTIESQYIEYNLEQGTLKAGSKQNNGRVEVILLPAED